eukprot:TRINITY_DN13119_c0_g1_i1.p1 TRINITY_DN13119_c0_g1~~TRINITY_DN13119_c0_g1_i1.p1  ORF type:complete len:186 (-),score=39.67 TRINITY_DN13119_c0_g1_i1:24-581(-)
MAADAKIGRLQYKKLEQMFKIFDFDRNGFVEESDFRTHGKNLAKLRNIDEGSATYTAFLDSILKFWDGIRIAADADQDGRVDFGEWMSFWSNFLAGVSDRVPGASEMLNGAATSTFELLDANKDDKISAEEFAHWAKSWNVESNFAALDTKKKGWLSRDEVVSIVREFYLSNDPEAVGNGMYGNF